MTTSRYRRLLYALLVASLLLLAGRGQAQRVTAVDQDKSTITFVSKQMNVPVEGKFARFSVQLTFDAAKPNEGRVLVDLDLASIDTGSEEANEEVKGKGWFDVKNHPTARFVSSGVRTLGPGRYELAGKLTIKGRSGDVVAPFTFKPVGQGAVFDGAFVLKRLDYAIGEGIWSDIDTVANEVQVKFRISAVVGPPKK
jgi:polyisoprenoid-binding protein YceI